LTHFGSVTTLSYAIIYSLLTRVKIARLLTLNLCENK